MSARLKPGCYNPDTLRRLSQAKTQSAPRSTRRSCLAQDRYGLVVEHDLDKEQVKLTFTHTCTYWSAHA